MLVNARQVWAVVGVEAGRVRHESLPRHIHRDEQRREEQETHR